MRNRHEFDDARDGDLRLSRTGYEFLQDAYRGLRDEFVVEPPRPRSRRLNATLRTGGRRSQPHAILRKREVG